MTTDSEARTIRDFLLSNPDHLTVARAVHESWPAIKDDVCRTFLEHLCSRIERKVESEGKLRGFIEDMHIGFRYVGEQRWVNKIWLLRTCWVEFEEADDEFRRTIITLEADGEGPCNWYLGVAIPKSVKYMKKGEKKRRNSFIGALKTELDAGSGTRDQDWYVWWDWVDDKWKNWNPLLPELRRESESDKGGEITDYFVDKFTEVAMKAIPVINKFEGKGA